MARSSIGLDVGTRAVAIAEISAGAVTRFGRILVPAGAVDNGEVHDPQKVAEAITTLWKRLGLPGRSVHVGFSNRRVVVRIIELPALAREDLDGAIRFQAQEHIPIPLAEAVMAYEVLGESETADGQKFQRVLVVAAERGTIDPLLETLKLARLDPKSLELNAYALVRCFAGDSDGAELILDVGAGVTNVVVQQEGKIRFTRILPSFGGDEFTMAVAEGLGVDRDEAESIKRRTAELLRKRSHELIPAAARASGRRSRAPTPAEEDDQPDVTDADEVVAPAAMEIEGAAMKPAGADQIQAAVELIEPVLQRFVNEVRGSVDFYTGQADSPQLERAILTGGGALLGGLAERLAESLGIPVELGHPLSRVPAGRMNLKPEEVAVAEPYLGVAVGLAMAGAQT